MNNALITLIISVTISGITHATEMEPLTTKSLVLPQNAAQVSLYQAHNVIIYNSPSQSNEQPHSCEKECAIQNKTLGATIGTWLGKSIASAIDHSSLALLSTAGGIFTAHATQKITALTLENMNSIIMTIFAIIHHI